MTKFARMIDVLDLYSERDTLLTAEDVAARMQISRPTAFRYVRELSRAGFLANYSGRYSLGARIITLDFRIRESDPVLKVARGIMPRLSTETACSSILCRMYNDEIINVHHEVVSNDDSGVTFGRGRPLPLFRGSASKVMLANLPAARLKKICERHQDEPDLQALGADWPAIRAYFADIRRVGYYISNEEIDYRTVGIAAPIRVPGVGTVAVVSLVFSVDRLAMLRTEGLADILKLRMADIAEHLTLLSDTVATAG